MRVLLVTQDFPPGFVGGISSWAQDLAEALHGNGDEVTVLARGTGDTTSWDEQAPFPVVRMAGRSWGRWQGLWSALATLPRLGTDLVVLCATWPLAAGIAPLIRPSGAKLGVAFHGSDLTRLSEASPGLQRAASAATALLPVSQFLGQELTRLGIGDAKVSVLPMALPLGPYDKDPDPRSGLLTVARLTPLKGIERCVAIAQRLDIPLTVIGDGPQAKGLQDRVRTPGVAFVGALPRHEILTLYRRAQATLLLSRPDTDGRGSEGLGLTLLESAAQGTPCIGCTTGGIPEAVGPGLVLPDPDNPDLDAVRALLDDPTSGWAAREWVAAHHGPQLAVAALHRALA